MCLVIALKLKNPLITVRSSW